MPKTELLTWPLPLHPLQLFASHLMATQSSWGSDTTLSASLTFIFLTPCIQFIRKFLPLPLSYIQNLTISQFHLCHHLVLYHHYQLLNLFPCFHPQTFHLLFSAQQPDLYPNLIRLRLCSESPKTSPVQSEWKPESLQWSSGRYVF